MKYVYKDDISRFVQFAIRVWDVIMPLAIKKDRPGGIERLKKYFSGLGLPVSLKELNIGMTAG